MTPSRLSLRAIIERCGVSLEADQYDRLWAYHGMLRAANAELNGFTNITWMEADAFETLRAYERARERFDTVVLDPPAFAKSRATVPQALRGYREINLRALRILAPGGSLVTASCSFHVRRPEFLGMLAEAAGDSGRRVILRELLGQGDDHPEVLTIPETGYLKGAVLTVP